jgi:predicted RNA-binding Zn ribbon-like protein
MSSATRIARLSIPRDGLCLDYVNTLGWRGMPAPTEGFAGMADVLGWVGAISPAHDALARQIGAQWRTCPAAENAAFAAAIGLREILHRLFASLAAGAPPDLSSLNVTLQQAAPRRRLTCDGGAIGWEVADPQPSAATLLSPVLWSAADLLAGPHRARVRQCANPKCGFLFLDDSKGGNRRWCSMSACGNRAKAQRHYRKQKLS